MELSDVIPPAGYVQRIYCEDCGHHLDLAYADFEEDVSSVAIRIEGLPVLRCAHCEKNHLPDLARLAILDVHKRALAEGSNRANVKRRKRSDKFNFSTVPFLYDPDDYYYIPGLFRPFDPGFLTPVFFKRAVLLKYDNSPEYRVQFASTTYGQIVTPEDYVSFGINRFGNVVMWLGDIAKLPEAEQYYLRSENVPSDHSLGSEFYDGQIECVFTEPSVENALFRIRSEFVDECFKAFGLKIAHLDAEVVDLALTFNAPVVDTPKERRHVADTLNKIYVESLDNKALGDVLSSLGGDPKSLGSLKRLQAILERIAPTENVALALSPLFVLYDLRVAYSHLTSDATAKEMLGRVGARLGTRPEAELAVVYRVLSQQLTQCFSTLKAVLEAHVAGKSSVPA